MSELKNVVIVGAGPFSGGPVAAALSKTLPSTHRLVLIDARDFAYVTGMAARAAVVPGWELDAAFPIKTIFGDSSRHILLLNTSATSLSSKTVTINKPAPVELGGRETIHADVIILATASTYTYPATVPEGTTLDEARAKLRQSQEQVKAAKSVLVVGGGPYACEFSGEVLDQYPGKSVTLVTKRSTLMGEPFVAKLGQHLATQLKQRGAKIIFDDSIDERLDFGPVPKRTFKTQKGVEIQADFVLGATGSSTNSKLVSDAFPGTVASDGRIKAKNTLQLEGQDRIFGIGDILDLGGLPRTGVVATFQTPVLVKNVLALIAGKPLSPFQSGSPAIFVSVGPSGGSAVLFGFTLPTFMVRMIKSKGLLKSKIHATYKYKRPA